MERTFWLDMLTVTNYNFKKLTNTEIFNNKGIWQKGIHFRVYYATQTCFLPSQCGMLNCHSRANTELLQS